MIQICFVCLGNICRSPMAEFVMKKIVAEHGVEHKYSIVSKATHSDNIWNGTGAPIYPRAQHCLRAHGVPFEKQKQAALLKKSDYDRFDYLIGMDQQNLRHMQRLFGGDPAHKIHALMSFTPAGGEVADPWYTGDFETAYRDIVHGCQALFEQLEATP